MQRLIRWYPNGGKRAIDIFLSSILLVVLTPGMLILSVAIRATLGSPVLFRQWRPGLGGKPFNLFKFRTMNNEPTTSSQVESDGQRLTRFGIWLRSTSLDELPELVNVFRGQMSLVGPRPLLLEYLPLYNDKQSRRHEVRPGLTGWAQVNGRNSVSWQEKFELDVWYVDHVGLVLDIRILARTLATVFTRSGINAHGEATTSLFRGN